MKVSPIRCLMAMSLAATAAIAMADATLTLGSPAPALKVAKWVKGKPIAKFETGKVYVVEFWATWCGPCKTSIPHLTELAKKYAGKATFTGVSVFEEKAPKDEKYIAKVEDFVKEWGSKMDYNVAVDGKEGWMGQNWMTAAQQPGIPTAFVIDQKGKVAWIGHPMDRLDEVVGQVVAGTYDVEAEKTRIAAMKAQQAKAEAEFAPFMNPLRKGDYPLALAEMDKAFAKNPQLENRFGMAKFQALTMTQPAAAMEYARTLSTGVYKDQPMMLNSIAWAIVDDKSTIKNPDYKVAVEVAERGVAALKPEAHMEAAYILDTLAYAYFKDGQIDRAIATQEKALAAGARVKDFDSATRKEMEERLSMFKAKKG